jgi:topoisomerase-4 subunit B
MLGKDSTIEQILEFYMGKNTAKRQEFIIENLRVEKDPTEQSEKNLLNENK